MKEFWQIKQVIKIFLEKLYLMKDRKGENLKIELLFFFAVNFIRQNDNEF